MAELFVRTRGSLYGPYSEAELSSKLKAGQVPFSAWVHRSGNWALLAEITELRALHPEFEERPTSAPSAGAAQSASALSSDESGGRAAAGGTVSAEPIWFYAREKRKFGPFSAAELVGQLQRKSLEPTTFVWRPGFTTWQRMSQVAEFSRESMRRLATDGTPVDILVKRKHQRTPYEVEIIAHDNTRAIEGRSMVIGEGGLFLATPKPIHKVGARLKLHFREGTAPSFNAVAEVVSVVRGEMAGYCMRFVALSETDRRKITKLVNDRK